MRYVQVKDGAVWRTVGGQELVDWDEDNRCTPEALVADGKAEAFGVAPLTEALPPVVDPDLQTVQESTPECVDGSWVQRWQVVDLEPAAVQANLERRERNRVARLWQAAHDYEFFWISGSAIGLLAMGVLAGRPKCVAVQAWIKSIWTLYYTRKASGSAEVDFSSCGPCPHSVPELMAELGV